MNSNYMVLDIKKSNELKKLIDHITRKYITNNINTSLSHKNIELIANKYDSNDDFLDKKREQIKSANKLNGTKNRMIKDKSMFFQQIMISSSKDHFKNEEENIQYLRDALDFFKKRFPDQEFLYADIHLDETTPHLHLGMSFFNEKENKFNQKQLSQKHLTDYNNVIRDFQKSVANKYNLKRGEIGSAAIHEKSLHPDVVSLQEELKGLKKLKEDEVYKPIQKLGKEYVPRDLYDKMEKVALKAHKLSKKPNKANSLTYNKQQSKKMYQSHKALENRHKIISKLKELTPKDVLGVDVNNGKYLIQNPFNPKEGKKNFYLNYENGGWYYFDLINEERGDMLDLYMRMNNMSFNEVVEKYSIDNSVELAHYDKIEIDEAYLSDKTMEDVKTRQLSPGDYHLRDYLFSRGINNLKVHDVVGVVRNDKWGIDNLYLKNDSDGLVMFNKGFKSNYGRTNATTKNFGTDTTIIVEGVMDYLTLLQEHGDRYNYICLNSITNWDKVNLHKNQTYVFGLDNDEKGQETAQKLINKANALNIVNINVKPFNKDWNDDLQKNYMLNINGICSKINNIGLDDIKKKNAKSIQDLKDRLSNRFDEQLIKHNIEFPSEYDKKECLNIIHNNYNLPNIVSKTLKNWKHKTIVITK